MNALYGLWGGVPPGGWCTFASSHESASHLGYTNRGTREEAEAGKKVFDEERTHGCSHWRIGCSYEVAAFDLYREPAAPEQKGSPRPSSAQVTFMSILVKDEREGFPRYGAQHAYDAPRAMQTSRALFARGWIHTDGDGHLRLTRCGSRVLCGGVGEPCVGLEHREDCPKWERCL